VASTHRFTYFGAPYDEQRLYAVLVRSERVDGKPRQRVVKHLAGIRAWFAARLPDAGAHLRPQAWKARHWFWKDVDAALAELVPEPADRERIASTIAATVPRLSADEEAEWHAESERAQARLAVLMRMAR
jgi:hypothetical protein